MSEQIQHDVLGLIPLETEQHSKTTYEVIVGADNFLQDLDSSIRRAQNTVNLQFYIFEGDEAGKFIGDSLLSSASQGRNTRLIVDHYIDFSINDNYLVVPRLNIQKQLQLYKERRQTHRLFKKLKDGNADVQLINPLGFFYHKILSRDHKKLVVLDGENIDSGTTYLGGCNICDHEREWRTFMVKMQGDVVPILQDEFNATWRRQSVPRKIPYSDGVVLTDAQGVSVIYPEALNLIDSAQERLVLESPYFWGQPIETALFNAVNRGVDVSVIVPQNNNKNKCVPNLWLYRRFAKLGIPLYLYQGNGGMTHAKALISDNVAMFGSSNFHNVTAGYVGETNIMTGNLDLVAQMEQVLNTDINNSIRF